MRAVRSAILTLTLAFLLLAAGSASARTKYWTFVQQGGVLANSFNTPVRVQRTCVGATVTVYQAGTSTRATIYSDEAGTAIVGDLTVPTTGLVQFWTDDATFKLTVSGGGCSYTIDDIPVPNSPYNEFNPRSFGAVGNNVDDDITSFTACWNAAIAASSSTNPVTIVIPAGRYRITAATPKLESERINIRGEGSRVSVLIFNPTVDSAAIEYQPIAGGSTIDNIRITGVGIEGSASTRKTGFRLGAVRTSLLFDVLVQFTGNSGDIGLHVQGWDQTDVYSYYFRAARPVVVSAVTAGTMAGQGAFDHWNFHNGTLTSTDNLSYLFEVESSVTGVSKFSMTGRNVWLGGLGVFKFASTGVLNEIAIENGRWEQGPAGDPASYDATGYYLWLAPGTLSARSRFSNLRGSVENRNGVYMRNIRYSAFTESAFCRGTFVGEICLDMDNSNDNIHWRNVSFADSANAQKIIGDQLEITRAFNVASTSGTPDLWSDVIWSKRSALGSSLEGFWIQNVYMVRRSETMANDATYVFAGASATRLGSMIVMATDTAGRTAHVACHFGFAGTAMTKLSGSANCTTSPAAPNLSVEYSGSNVTVTNKTGAEMEVRIYFN